MPTSSPRQLSAPREPPSPMCMLIPSPLTDEQQAATGQSHSLGMEPGALPPVSTSSGSQSASDRHYSNRNAISS